MAEVRRVEKDGEGPVSTTFTWIELRREPVCEIWCGRTAARGERGGAASSVGVEETQSLVPAAIAKLGSISSLSLLAGGCGRVRLS